MDHVQVGRRSTADDVAEAVLAAIRNGEYGVGERLPTEPELARQLGVGRTSVREGIGQLRMLGVVEVRRGLGTFVTHIEGDPTRAFLQWTTQHRYQIVSLFEVRMSLEGTAASLAAQRADQDQIQALHAAADAHHSAHLANDLAELVRTDQDFHASLVLASKNEALYDVYGPLVPRLRDYRRKSLALEGAPKRSSHDHHSIVEAIREKDPQAARQSVLKHLTTLYQEVLAAGEGIDSAATGVPWL
jgi:GntR family transcriptional regulator, transcriptional repressor for pyruvate dehydrogenase complex